MTRRSGSVPDLSLVQEGVQDQEQRRNSPSQLQPLRATTFDELYYKHIGFRGGHHHPSHRHGGRRARRSREYDSDTGYRSDRDVYVKSHHGKDSPRGGAASSEILSVRSQPAPYNHHRRHSHGHGNTRGKGREGYASDIGPYSTPVGAGMGSRFPTANAAAAAFQQNKNRNALASVENYHESDSDHLFQQPSSQAISSSSPSLAWACQHNGSHQPGSNDYDYHYHSKPYVRRTTDSQNISNSHERIPVSVPSQDYHGYCHNTSNNQNQQSTPLSHQQHSGLVRSQQSFPLTEQTQIQSQRQADSNNVYGVLRPPVAPKPKLNNSLHNSATTNKGSSSPVPPSPGFHNESFMDQSTPVGAGNPSTSLGATTSLKDNRDANMYSLMEGNPQNQNLVSEK